MSGSYSPYTRSGYSDDHSYYNSPSPTPSPRPASYMYGNGYPQRPATRAHFRTSSQNYADASTRPPTASPRYTSDGHYATKTANVSARHLSPVYSPSTPPSGGRHARRSSSGEVRGPYGVGKVVEFDGVYYIVGGPDQKLSRRSGGSVASHSSMRHATDFFDSKQSGVPGYNYPREVFDDARTPRPGHSKRRSSVSTPQRPSTARPSSSHKTKPPVARSATEADRAKHKIPQGYSLKNWDPAETPILLLGSVFDANSLGKWVYDWTVYHHGPATPISEMAGDLWLLLIQFAGKVKSAEEVAPRVRSSKNREIIEDFILSGERLSGRLSELLKRCEEPMLRASKKKDGSTLGKNAGVEFVITLFGRDREIDRTQKFMKAVELFIKRFTANCEDIIKHPTM